MLLLLSFALFLLSMLNWFEFDIIVLWQLSVLSKEFGHFFALLSLAVFVWQTRHFFATPKRRRWLVIGFSAIATFGFFRPVDLALKDQDVYERDLQSFAQKIGVPEFQGPLFSFWKLWRWPIRAEFPYQKIEYKAADGSDLHLDFYPPATETPAPLVIIVHGGGWEGGNTQQLPALNRELHDAGYAVASISYRFSPDHVWPAQRDDVNQGIDLLMSRAVELKINPQQLLILGRSAGGQIAGIVAYTRTDLPIKGYINFYGPTDLDFGFEVTIDGDILDSRNLLRRFLTGDPDQAAPLYASSSVIEAAKTRAVPTLLVYGEADRLVWHKHGERLRRRLNQSGIPVVLIDMKWGTHGFDFNPSGPAGQISGNAVLFFAKSVLK